MNLTVVVRYIGIVLVLSAVFMFVSAGVGLLYADGSASILIMSGLLTALFGLFPLLFVPRPKQLFPREAVLIVAGGWLVTCLAGTLPYLMYGGPFTAVNAVFESVSGFTTTGSSILSDIEAIPKGLLFWRSSTHWIGGTGIIIFTLAILPTLGTISPTLLRNEFTSLVSPPGKSRASSISRVIVIIYVGLTALETLALLGTGLSLFDAVTTSFGTIATGGFSPRNYSIATYNSVAVESVVMLFMVLSGINFGFLYGVVIRKGYQTSAIAPVIRVYLGIMIVSTVFVTAQLTGLMGINTWEALRQASFQVISVGTSAGFASADSSIWPSSSQLVLVLMTLICATAGSTSGGIKTDRIYLFGKLFTRQFWRMVHPEMILPISHGPHAEEVLSKARNAMLFIVAYLAVVGTAAFLLTVVGVSPLEAFSGSAAAMGNVGPGLGTVGSMGNYAALPNLAKLILSAVMLIGRLEIFGMIVIFTPVLWRS